VTLDLPEPSATAALGAQIDAALGPRGWKAREFGSDFAKAFFRKSLQFL
jgi:hypothetical protein